MYRVLSSIIGQVNIITSLVQVIRQEIGEAVD